MARWNFEEKEVEKINNLVVIRVGYNQKSYLSLPISQNPIWKKSLDLLLKSNIDSQYDLIICREIMLGELSGKLAKKFNIPLVIDMAENYPAAMREWKKYNSNTISKFLVHTLKVPDNYEKNTVKYSDAIIVVCDEQIERLNKQYNFSKNKITIVHNTPNQKYNSNLQNFNFDPNKEFTFLHHGFLTAEKSIENFLHAFLEISSKYKNLKFVIAGNGECFDQLNEIRSKHKNKDAVVFTGKYNHKQLEDLLANVNCGVIPYQISDFNNYTIHNKIFDYFSASIPVLVSEAIPLKRIVKETKSGLSLDMSSIESCKQAIESILTQDLNKFSKNALSSFSNKYNWAYDEKILYNFVNELIEKI